MATHQVPRRPGDQTFRKNDVLRMIDCAERKRLSDYKIMVGGITLAVGELGPTTTTETTNELDQWMEKKKKHES